MQGGGSSSSNNPNAPPINLGHSAARTSVREHGQSYAASHGHAARQRRQYEREVEEESDDDEYDMYTPATSVGGRIPIPPTEQDSLFRKGQKDSPRQKNIKGRSR